MALPELTDAELAESRKLLLRFAHIQLPDRPDLAEDLVQETMLSAYRAAEGFKGGAQVSSWLFAILKKQNYRLPAPNRAATPSFRHARRGSLG